MAKILPTNAAYGELSGRKELHRLLDEGLLAMKDGGGRLAKDVFSDIEKEYGLSEE